MNYIFIKCQVFNIIHKICENSDSKCFMPRFFKENANDAIKNRYI